MGELMRTWRAPWDPLVVRLYDTGKKTPEHRTVVAYELEWQGEIIFSDTLLVSQYLSIDGDHVIQAALVWSSLTPGQASYDYTAHQEKWVLENGERLSQYVHVQTLPQNEQERE